MRPLLTALLLPACAGEYTRDDLLEAPRVEPAGDLYFDEHEEVPLAGAAAADPLAGEGDWRLTFDEVALDVHSPGRLDLSALDGRELSGGIQREDGQLSLSDAEGLLYAIAWASPEGLPAGTFGRGGEIGSERLSGERYTYYALAVQADDGQRELAPGESAVVEIEGQTWRVVHHGSYAIDYGAYGKPKCGSSEAISFEVLRAEDGEDEVLARPKGEKSLDRSLSCG